MKQVVLFLAMVGALAAPCYGGSWLDDWVDSSVSGGMSTFETQKSKYATFGTYSARWNPGGTIHPITISKPKFSYGCGGIDIGLGGISFMDFDYLVERSEKILGPAAAAFAFDVALNTLCPDCSSIKDRISGIIDGLNGLQLDSCKAQKAVRAYLHKGTGDPVGMASEQSQAITEFATSTGIEALHDRIVKKGSGKTTEKALDNAATMQDLVSSCPAMLKDVFFKKDTYLLDNLVAYAGYPEVVGEMFRGIMGDFLITDVGNLKPISFCEENHGDIDEIILGMSQIRKTGEENCSSIDKFEVDGVNYLNILDYVNSLIHSIGKKMGNPGDPNNKFTDAEEKFLGKIRFNLLTELQTVCGMGGTIEELETRLDAVENNYGEYIAGQYALNMMRDFILQIQTLVANSVDEASQGNGATDPNRQDNCQIQLAQPIIDDLRNYAIQAEVFYGKLHTSFQDKQDLIKTSLELNRDIDMRKKTWVEKTKRLFAPME